MGLTLFDWQSSEVPDIETLAKGIEIDVGLVSSGNMAILTLPITGGDIYISGQKVSIFAVTDINLKGRTIFLNNRNNLAPLSIPGSTKSPASTSEGDIFATPKSNINVGTLNHDTGSGIVSILPASGYYCAFDNIVGNNGVTIAATPTIIGFNNIRLKDSYYQSVPNNAANSGVVQVIQDGVYEISYGANFTRIAGIALTAELSVKSELYINGVALPGSATRDSNINETLSDTTFGMTASTLAVLKAGDLITLRANKEISTNHTVRTNNNEVWIMIIKLR